MATQRKKEPPLYTLTAGAVAGAAEAVITYPTEYVKTQLQLQDGGLGSAKNGGVKFKGPVDCLVSTVRTQGVTAIYRGLSALVIGTAAKAGVRFFAFDQFREMLKDADGNISGVRSMLAGLGAGMTEAVLVVTPTETIKTKLIHDGNLLVPKYNGLVHGVTSIVKAEGFGGIYRGVVPVMARQGANSAVRFGVYSTLSDMAKAKMAPGAKLPTTYSFGIGALAGIITVYTTMPLDVVKTKMQGLRAKELYSGAFDCAWKVFKNEGVLAFWKGATPRLARLSMSGGIIFSLYESTMNLLHRLDDHGSISP
ncbi:solute carrier family 25 (mitochondrial citrate transporter), member 1 [Entomortierella parvispora]|uniref:Solute carrier family 25 (Mitochondrial citrate transporter), member 1 n=1 Tax=Entomortierella parvispora TaxID=205924 RepID=A0A9P3HM02_9FUNG|nr:solute carrier family 25 (mitochondrial citrate transporter), member 1 [Entomortierella parvispora]